jgi:hypothetical protein
LLGTETIAKSLVITAPDAGSPRLVSAGEQATEPFIEVFEVDAAMTP